MVTHGTVIIIVASCSSSMVKEKSTQYQRQESGEFRTSQRRSGENTETTLIQTFSSADVGLQVVWCLRGYEARY